MKTLSLALPAWPGIAFLAGLAMIAAVAAWTDLRQRRIPNWLCAINLVLGLSFVGQSDGLPGAGLALAHVVVALVVGMGLFALGTIGAGDAKYYASMAAWLPISAGIALLVAVAIAGFALLVVFALTRLRGRASRDPEVQTPFDKLPYGIAIGIGGLTAAMVA